MKRLYFESKTTLQFSEPVINHYFLLRFIPPSFCGQTIRYSQFTLSPETAYNVSKDCFGNLIETGCILSPHSKFVYSISGCADISVNKNRKESLNPVFKYPSSYTHISPEMISFAKCLSLQGSTLDKGIQLSDAIYEHITYMPGVTSTSTNAAQAFALKQGVCQDFAHIYISIARYLGIPTRYANGLPLGNGESHAWVEIYCNGMWIGIDPSRGQLVSEDYIRFCIGRDFLDCALERGVLTGNAFQTQLIQTTVSEQ